MVTAVWDIHWPINAFWHINKSTHIYTVTNAHQMATPPLTLYIRVPVATGQNRSHLNRAFLVHRWALSLSLPRLFFIVLPRISVSLTANESRSACAGLLLQDRWDSVEMGFGGWPIWCNHNVARIAFSILLIVTDERRTHAGAHKCTQAHKGFAFVLVIQDLYCKMESALIVSTLSSTVTKWAWR